MLENVPKQNQHEGKDCMYDINLQVRDGKYHFYIKGLQIQGVGKSLELAYDDLLSKKEKITKEFEEVGVALPIPRESSGKKFSVGEFGVFLSKCLVVLFLFVGCFSYASRKINDVLKENISQIHSRLSRINTNQLEEALYQAASAKHNPSPERREKIIASIRTLVQRNKPFVDELKPLFSSK